MEIHREAMLPRFKPIFHRPMMQIANGLDDGKTQSVALLPYITRTKTAEQCLPVKLFAIRRHIADCETLIFHNNLHFASLCRMAYGIDDKVFQQTFQKDGIGANHCVRVGPSVDRAQGCSVQQSVKKRP